MTEAAIAATDKRGPLPAALDASKRVAAKPEAAAQVAPQVHGDRTTVPWSAVKPSVHNPRKHFDTAKIATLAASIAVDGVLQNLTVRPDPKTPGSFEIAIGESRWRAVGELIAQGKADKSFALPVLIRNLTNIELIEIALAENMQRNDLTPIEEAEGLRSLESKGVSTADIAKRIGFSQRYVQQRLALAKNLAPEARAALEKGEIKVETARILVAAPQDRQAQILKEIGPGKHGSSGYEENPDDLRELVKDHQIPEKHAIFDLGQYKGEWLPGEKDGERFFADTVQFLKLQKAAIFVKRKALEDKGAAWVATGKFVSWNYDKKPGNKKAGVFIELADDGKVTVHKDLVEKPKQTFGATPKAADAKKEDKAEDHFPTDHRVGTQKRQLYALQRAVYDSADDAMRLICVWILTNFSAAGSPALDMYGEDCGIDDQVAHTLNGLLQKAPDAVRKGVKVSPQGIDGAREYRDKKGAVAKVAAVFAMTPAQVTKLFAALVAAMMTTDLYEDAGPTADVIALADALGIAGKEEKHGLMLQRRDLVHLGPPAIRAIARDLKVDQWMLRPPEALTKDIVKLIDAGKTDGYALPTVRFMPFADVKKACAAMLKGVDAERADAVATKSREEASGKAEPKAKAKKKAKR